MHKVLIADDESHIRLLLEQALENLEEMGVELFVARNGEEALEMIKQHKPRLVFLDIMMPKMSGYEVCDIVKNVLRMKDIYIILLTAKGQETDRQQGVSAGADVYVTKPFDPDEIYRKAAEILKVNA